MTPQEQIEELARELDGEAAASLSNGRDLAAQRLGGYAAKLRAISFDSPQISEGMVEAGAVAMMGLSYQRWDSLDEMAKNISRIKSRACLSAALTQKGDSNE